MLEKDWEMQKINLIIFIQILFGLSLPLAQVFANSMDEVICSAMKGMVEQELKKIPFKAGDYSVVGLSVDCKKKTLKTEKKHIKLKKTDFKANFQESSQKIWEKANCSNMIFNTETGWSTVQLVKGKEGVLVSTVRADFRQCSK